MKFKTIAAVLLGAATLAAAPALPVISGIWQDNAVVAEAAPTNNWYYYTTGNYQQSVVTYRLDTTNKQAYVYSSSGKSGTLTIPATVNYASYNYPIVGIDSYAFSGYTSLLTVDLTAASNLKSLGGYAFSNSTVQKVKLGGANLTIRENAFNNASALQTVEFTNNSNTLTVEKYAFINSGLRYFNFYGKKLTAKSYSFARTGSLKNFYINSKTDTVTIQTSAFAYSGINFLDVYCRSITIHSQAFEDAQNTFSSSSLQYVDFNSSVKVITLKDSAFAGLWALKTVSFYNPSVSLTMGKRMFAGSTVKTVNFPNSLTVIPESCFEYCSLTSSPITSNIQKIEANAFARATLPATVNIPAATTTIAESAFTYIYDVKEFKVDSGNTKFKTSNGGLYTSDLSRLICYPPQYKPSNSFVVIPAKTIPDGTLTNNPYIQSLNIQYYTRRSTDKSEFSDLSALTSIILPASEYNKSGKEIMTRFNSFFGFNSKVIEVNGNRIVQTPYGKEPCFLSKFASYLKDSFDAYEDRQCAFMASYVDEMASYVVKKVTTTSMSKVQKAVRLHQWICDRTTYNPKTIDNGDYTDHKDHTNASVFLHQDTYKGRTENVTVCEGYARCYKILMNKAGVETQYVSGGYYDENDKYHGHAWNIVKIDGKWYHVDVTWDDQEYDERYDGFKKTNRYMHFLCPDAVINTDHGKYNWASDDNSSLAKGRNVATDYNYYRLGDVNNDSKYNSNDQNLFDQFANGTTPSAMQKVRGDLNFDGKVNGSDRDLFNYYINNYNKASNYSRPALWRFTTLEK